jgi:NAD(P)-dependent dehydrogenase (short-subunit alcohol dehydrogenase family)
LIINASRDDVKRRRTVRSPAVELHDRVAVVTGAASGIGAASARAFAAAGAIVAVVDRNAAGAKAVADEIKGLAVECDVGSEASVDAAFDTIAAELGPVEVCFNNAGIATGGDVLTTDPAVWDDQWAVNVMAHVYAVRKVLPGMLERGEGYLLHTASMAGILTTHGNATYATTKHAVVGLAEWEAITYHDRGVRTSLLAPLGVRTPMVGEVDPSVLTVLGPLAEPEDVAALVVDAIREERFLILTNPLAQTWMDRKASDLERWLRGMRRVQAQLDPGSEAR